MVFRSSSSAATKQFAKSLAARILEKGQRRRGLPAGKAGATVLALTGDLGSGKTTFVQGFLRGLGVRGRITSPTFVLVKRYAIRHMPYARVYHIDAYRIRKPSELLTLGVKKILSDQRNIVLIEWVERIKKLLPKRMIWISFAHGRRASERTLTVEHKA